MLDLQRYLGGEQPRFADCITFGALQWARVVSPLEILEANDPVLAWRTRLLEQGGSYAARAGAAAGSA